MSIVKRIIRDSIERAKVDELLANEYEQAGYGGIQLTKTPMGAQINLFAMRPGRVIGKRGRAIKEASERLERELGLANPQITVVEVEVPELNPRIMASRIANALERGIHFRRAIFWSLNRIMENGALGCEVLLKGPLRSARSRFEKVVEGYVPKSGEPALRWVKTATIHVKMKRGTLGVTVKIVPPEAKFPDKITLDNLPEIEYQLPQPESKVTPDQETSQAEPSTTTETVQPEPIEQPVSEEPIKEHEPEKEPETVQPESSEQPVIEEPIKEPEPEAVQPESSVQPILEEPETVQPEPIEQPVSEEPIIEPEPEEEPKTEQLKSVEQPEKIDEPKSESEPELESEQESTIEPKETIESSKVKVIETSEEPVSEKDSEEEQTEK